MFCTNCGAHIEDGGKFCTSCGQPVEAEAVSARGRVAGATPTPVSPQVGRGGSGQGAPVQTSSQVGGVAPARTSSQAGGLTEPVQPVQAASAYAPGVPSGQKPRKRRRGRVALIVVLVFALIAGCGIAVWGLAFGGFELLGSGGLAGLLGREVQTVAYGSTEPVVVSPDTSITAYNADDEPIERGSVQLIPVEGAASKEWTYVKAPLGEGGVFTMESFSDIPTGTYAMRLFEGDQQKTTLACPNIELVAEVDKAASALEYHVDKSLDVPVTQEVATYTAETEKQTVELTMYYSDSSYDLNIDWLCAQFASSGDAAGVDVANKQLRKEYDDALERARGWSPSDSDPLLTLYRQEATAVDSVRGLGAVRIERQEMFEVEGGTDSDYFVEGRLFDLKTGEELPARDYFDLSEEECIAAAKDALIDYVSAKKGTLSFDKAESLAKSGTYVVGAHAALVLVVDPTELGLPEGRPVELVVAVREAEGADVSLVGEDIGSDNLAVVPSQKDGSGNPFASQQTE